MANQRNILTGDMSTVEDKAISISLERYNELIKKEAFYDELSSNKIVLVKLLSNECCITNKEEDNN